MHFMIMISHATMEVHYSNYVVQSMSNSNWVLSNLTQVWKMFIFCLFAKCVCVLGNEVVLLENVVFYFLVQEKLVKSQQTSDLL